MVTIVHLNSKQKLKHKNPTIILKLIIFFFVANIGGGEDRIQATFSSLYGV